MIYNLNEVIEQCKHVVIIVFIYLLLKLHICSTNLSLIQGLNPERALARRHGNYGHLLPYGTCLTLRSEVRRDYSQD